MESTLNAPASMPAPAPEAAVERAPDTVALEPGECARLIELAGGLSVSPTQAPELYCRQARRAARAMPDRIAELLADFASKGTESGTMLFDGLPAGSAPPTPPDNRRHLGESTTLARVQAILNHACGEMVAYEAEGHGRLYQDMVPNRALAQSQTSLGSRVELELHTEQAFSKLKPDVLSLACLRGHPDAKTYVLPAHVLVSQLNPFERKLVREPLWMTGVDGSFCQGGHEFIEGDKRGPLALVAGAEEDPTIVFDQDLMRGLSDEAHAMIARVTEIYHAHRGSHTLAPGQILLVDNVRAVHGRSPFEPSFDGSDRFIVRSFAVRDLVRTRYARPGNGRTIAAEHS